MSLASLADEELLRTDRARLDLSKIVEPQLRQLKLNQPNVDMDRVRSAMTSVAAANPVANMRPRAHWTVS